MTVCTCGEHFCKGVYRYCPTAVTIEGGHFNWGGDYDQDAVVDDLTVNIGLNDVLSLEQPGDKGEEPDLILVFGRDNIRKLREILQQAEEILDKRGELKI